MNWQERITSDPEICFGKPVIKGTRIWVALILDLLANGNTRAEILEEYTTLDDEDIAAALQYAARMSHERFVPVTFKTP